jgi:hypothetical protein
MTQTQGPGDKDRLLWTERPLCPFFTPVLARKQSGRRDGLSPGLEDTTRTEGASHASTRGIIPCKLATSQPPLSGPYCRRETVGLAATQLVEGGCLQVAPALPKHKQPTHQHTNPRPRKGNYTTYDSIQSTKHNEDGEAHVWEGGDRASLGENETAFPGRGSDGNGPAWAGTGWGTGDDSTELREKDSDSNAEDNHSQVVETRTWGVRNRIGKGENGVTPIGRGTGDRGLALTVEGERVHGRQ